MIKFTFADLSPRKKQMIIALAIFGVIIVLAVVGVTMTKSDKKGFMPQAVQKPVSTNISTPGAQVDAKSVWMGMSAEQIKTLQDENKKMLENQQRLEDAVKKLQGAKDDIASAAVAEGQRAQNRGRKPSLMPPGAPPGAVLPSALDEDGNLRGGGNIAAGSTRGSTTRPAVLPPPPGVPGQRNSGAVVADGRQGVSSSGGIFTVSLSEGGSSIVAGASPAVARAAATQKIKVKTTDNYLPSGAFVRGVLLSGLDAATGGQAQSNPTPTLIRLIDLSVLPNRQHFNIKECFVVGAGYGDISSERAYIRTESLSCVLNDGHIVDQNLSGYIVDSTGNAGIRGRLVTKQGQVLANAALAGIASGIGGAFAQAQTTTSISPLGATQTIDNNKVVQAGVAGGFHTAMDRLANYYITLAEKLFPIIEISAGQPVDIVITKGTFFDDDVTTPATATSYERNPSAADNLKAQRAAYEH